MRNSFFGEFDERITRIDRKHQKMRGGYRAQDDGTGLIRIRPNPRLRRTLLRRPLRVVVFLVLGLTLFKAVLLTDLGPATYAARLAPLADGAIWDRAGGFVMQVDPVTRAISHQLNAALAALF
ncbi:hypothetical protein [Pseudooceanicola aestuarii]|uniref:hypothetical protein n=1 Tax=Pseudooceanicola aestuarii TaxID=2697319 RepID=UPI0013D49F5D|nr:hypothetical protein [Pseudooceanicola aestuarii]